MDQRCLTVRKDIRQVQVVKDHIHFDDGKKITVIIKKLKLKFSLCFSNNLYK